MSTDYLAQAARDVPSLRAVFVTAMPDCLLYDSWLAEGSEWKAEEIASYLGDLFRANREGLKALGSWSTEMQVSIESPEYNILLKELRSDFVLACVFDRDAALGMARLYTQRMLQRIAAALPSFQVEERPRGVRVMDFLNRYAPDPHAVLLRVSLRTGLPMEQLQRPEALALDHIAQIEKTAAGILGLESLNI